MAWSRFYIRYEHYWATEVTQGHDPNWRIDRMVGCGGVDNWNKRENERESVWQRNLTKPKLSGDIQSSK